MKKREYKKALLKQNHLAKPISQNDLKSKSIENCDYQYLTPRERLDHGFIIDGEEFDMLMREEATDSVVHQLIEIRKLLIDITHLLGAEEKFYIDGKLVSKSELPSSNQ